jgi:hypothetical protein
MEKTSKTLHEELFSVPLNPFKEGETPTNKKLNRTMAAIEEARAYIMRLALWCLINSLFATVALIVAILTGRS